jgi:hypothetical protein
MHFFETLIPASIRRLATQAGGVRNVLCKKESRSILALFFQRTFLRLRLWRNRSVFFVPSW